MSIEVLQDNLCVNRLIEGKKKEITLESSIIVPDAVVCVATIRALKYHGGQAKEEIKTENLEALQKGIKNLNKHLDNLKNVFGLNVIVAINKFDTDTDAEIELLSNALREQNIEMSLVESHEKGSEGAIDLAENEYCVLAIHTG